MTLLLVEQNAAAALEIADRAFVLETGRITLSGPAWKVANDPGGGVFGRVRLAAHAL